MLVQHLAMLFGCCWLLNNADKAVLLSAAFAAAIRHRFRSIMAQPPEHTTTAALGVLLCKISDWRTSVSLCWIILRSAEEFFPWIESWISSPVC